MAPLPEHRSQRGRRRAQADEHGREPGHEQDRSDENVASGLRFALVGQRFNGCAREKTKIRRRKRQHAWRNKGKEARAKRGGEGYVGHGVTNGPSTPTRQMLQGSYRLRVGIVMKIAAVYDSVFWVSWAEQQGPHRSEAKAGRNELEPPCLVPDPIRLGHRLAFPAAGVHGRPCLLHRCLGRPQSLHRGEIYLRISSFWIKIFAVSFGMGVVSGIVMPFQIGTNWSRYSDAAADVVGPLLAYEGLTAFFLEAAFLGVLLFGRKLVPPWAHFVAALMVALGTLFSTFWIIATNSWMQTPAGYEIVDGRFLPKDWLQIIFSPSFPFRLAHVVDAVYITTSFVVIGVAASYLRQGRFVAEARTMLSMTLWLLTVLVPLQFLLGDAHGLNTLEHQPAKLAAIEAIWDTHG